ncbi:class C beta-lactamase-related serine hydrolase [Nocardia yunnanensis]|uniref:Class C beta-lactamase-related serine hydrolase n=1 Tax=Nocardia yunnanensis TaxID=2382165 RepID=A0A386ZP03_9NOCA|nr:serine hydrolase [Nocardia yunnanensis]AYF78429.1 class C beta-lactamase-related serine hydrolase [Nocardia yunnanensis]
MTSKSGASPGTTHGRHRLGGLGAAVLLASSLVFAQTGTAAAQPATGVCSDPSGSDGFQRADPAAAGIDPAALGDAMDFGKSKGAYAIQIYRHGCLVGDDTRTGNLPLPLASASKGVASVAVGRAITMGYFELDDPLGKFFPTADADHAALTVRQILNQTTGLRFTWSSDIAGIATDEVTKTLRDPLAFTPGTTFQYAQAALVLLPKIVEITTGSDFQDFVQRELMAPLGIDRDHWVWLRDRSGNTTVNGGLAMRADDLARLGQLMLRNGRWGERRLIDPDYIRQAQQPTSANGGYGFLFWLNAGDSYKTATVPSAKVFDHPMFPGTPRDLYSFVGALGQFVAIIPSRDMVIVRLGVPASIDPGNVQTSLAAESNPDNKEFLRRVTAAITDVPAEPYDEPYHYNDNFGPLVSNLDDLAFWTDPANVTDILLGVGPYASDNCNVLWCNGKAVPQDLYAEFLDVSGQVTATIQGLDHGQR